MQELMNAYWPQIVTAAIAIIWAIRQEGKIKHLERVQETEGARMLAAMDKMAATQEKMSDAINEMRTTLAGVVGYEKGRDDLRKRGAR